MRSHQRLLLAVMVVVTVLARVSVAGAQHWNLQQPPLPSPPEGQSSVGLPVALGHVGQISFWAPNRGLLITAGTEIIPAGLYYYNGVGWRELSTVCGGFDGRIAWAGENDFWTISDQQTGQQQGSQEGSSAENMRDISLCHFVDGQVVASYAQPIGTPGSYQHMYAAACSGPNDCWFGGDRLPSGGNAGAFHLHWNGQTLTSVPSLEQLEPQTEDPSHTVRSMVYYGGRFYESVQIQSDDQLAPGESVSKPFLIHRLAEGSSKPFTGMTIEGPLAEMPQKEGEREPFDYGGGEPAQLSAFQFSADASELWALASPLAGSLAHATALLLSSKGQFQQLRLSDPSGALAGKEVAGVAAEPGAEDAYLSVDTHVETSTNETVATVLRLHADGSLGPVEQLPEGSGSMPKGEAGAIDCPAREDCWMATSRGWLFHLGGGYPEDRDPYFQGLITYRPRDGSIPFLAPESFPEDDSGANPPTLPALPTPPAPHEGPLKVRAPLFSHVAAKLVGRTTLALTFTLATRSRVRLLALRRGHRVAQTKSYVLTRGRHTLELHLRPRAWPTRLDLRVQALGPVPLVSTGSGKAEASTGGPTTVGT